MRSDIANTWVTALRGGEFEQGKNYLHYNGTFCCLGVLCEVAVREGVINQPSTMDTGVGTVLHRYGADNQEGILPDEVMEWAGMLSDDGTYLLPTGAEETLAVLNDEGKADFNEIADIIEEHAAQL